MSLFAAVKASTDGSDTTTLFIAAGGLALAVLSLGWQLATFLLTGSRVRADVLRGGIFRIVLEP